MLIIINTVAAKARQSWPEIKKQLDAAGVDYTTYQTQRKGDATLQARVALNAGVQLIVVVGGDGTLSEAAEGFFQFHDDLDLPPSPINPSATLAFLPAGTGDDFARGLRRKAAPLNDWMDLLLSLSNGHATARPIDVLYGRCDDFQKPFI